jgi:hypothetical protein
VAKRVFKSGQAGFPQVLVEFEILMDMETLALNRDGPTSIQEIQLNIHDF